MDRINTENIILKDGKRLFKDGDHTCEPPEEATAVDAEWFNGVQEEILSLIEDEGLVPNPKKNTQLKEAVSKKLENSEKILKKRIESMHDSFSKSLKQLNSNVSSLEAEMTSVRNELHKSKLDMNRFSKSLDRETENTLINTNYRQFFHEFAPVIANAIEWVSFSGLKPGWKKESQKVANIKWRFINEFQRK